MLETCYAQLVSIEATRSQNETLASAGNQDQRRTHARNPHVTPLP